MSPNEDPRVRRTRERIRDAFITLLLERPFEQITVSALARRAGINRATFYRHYADVDDLADQLTDLLFADTESRFEQAAAADAAAWGVLFEHVAAYADFYRAMIRPGGIPGFRERVEAAVAAQMLRLLPDPDLLAARAQVPPRAAVAYLAAAQVGFIQWWLENDMPFPPQTAARHLLNLHWRGGTWALGLADG